MVASWKGEGVKICQIKKRSGHNTWFPPPNSRREFLGVTRKNPTPKTKSKEIQENPQSIRKVFFLGATERVDSRKIFSVEMYKCAILGGWLREVEETDLQGLVVTGFHFSGLVFTKEMFSPLKYPEVALPNVFFWLFHLFPFCEAARPFFCSRETSRDHWSLAMKGLLASGMSQTPL